MKYRHSHPCMRIIAFMLSVAMMLTAVSAEVFATESDNHSELSFATVSGLSYVSVPNRGDYNEAFLLDATVLSNLFTYLNVIFTVPLESARNSNT